MFVIPSDALTTTPAFVNTTASPMFLAYGEAITLNGSNVVTGTAPSIYMYAAADSSNNIHVYGLDLASASEPTQKQISSFSIALASGAAFSSVLCDFHQSATNLLDPTTTFVVIHTSPNCASTGNDVWQVVHYADSATTAPTAVTLTSTEMVELYAPSGALTGEMLLDGTYSLYANDSFTSPTVPIGLGAGQLGNGILYTSNGLGTGSAFTGTVLFFVATGSDTFQHLYRLPYNATTAAAEYKFNSDLVVTPGVSDGTNVYFFDNTQNQNTGNQLLLQEPLAGGATTTLYSGTSLGQLVGSNGSLVVLYTSTTNSSTFVTTNQLETLPVGTLSTSPTLLGSVYTGFATIFMTPTTLGTPSTDRLFVSVYSDPGGAQSYYYQSTVLSPSGTVVQALTNNSYFLPGYSTSPLSGTVMQLTNYNPGTANPGTLNAVNVSTLAATPLKSAGVTYSVPTDLIPVTFGLSSSIGAGQMEVAPIGNSTPFPPGLAYDLSKSLIVPISVSDTIVTLF